MHFSIYQIVPEKASAKAGMSAPELYDDVVVNYHTDYVGDEKEGESRKSAIEDLKGLLVGIAKVDVERGTVKFLNRDAIEATILEEAKKALDGIAERMAGKDGYFARNPFYLMRDSGHNFRGDLSLFYNNSYALTSAQWIEDCPYYAGKTFYIGSIFDAHC